MTEDVISPDAVAKALKSYEPGKAPQNVWEEMLRLNGTVTFEVIPYRIQSGKIEIYMTRRPADDPDWPNQMHCPGTMINGNDVTPEIALKRIGENELNGAIMDELEEIAPKMYRSTKRGVEDARVFIAKIHDGLPKENWYDAENLPEDTIDFHKEMIKVAVGAIKVRGQKRQIAAFE